MKKYWLVLVLAMLLCGCGGEAEFQQVGFKNAAAFPMETLEEFLLLDMTRTDQVAKGASWELYTEFGRFYVDLSNQENHGPYLLMFSDFASGESYVLCPKANCLHDSDDCGAYFSFGGGAPEHLYFDGQWLYFYLDSNQILYRQKPDGSERTELAGLSETYIDSILYESSMAYCLSEIMEQDEKTGEVLLRKGILCLDLKTGEKTMLPFSFEGNASQVELYWKYGDELVMRYSYSSGQIPFQDASKNRYIIFLFNIETGQITQLVDYPFTYIATASCPGYLIYCVFDPESERNVIYRGEEWWAFSGEICIFDLEKRICYRLESDCLTWEFSIRDGKLFYCELGADGKTLEGKIRDLATGEVTDWLFFDAEPQLRWLAETETGEHFIVMDGEQICRINKEDYYAGNRNLIPIP